MSDDVFLGVLVWYLVWAIASWLVTYFVVRWVVGVAVLISLQVLSLSGSDTFADWLEAWAVKNSKVAVDPNDDYETLMEKQIPQLHRAWLRTATFYIDWLSRFAAVGFVGSEFVKSESPELVGTAWGVLLIAVVILFSVVGDRVLPKVSSERK